MEIIHLRLEQKLKKYWVPVIQSALMTRLGLVLCCQNSQFPRLMLGGGGPSVQYWPGNWVIRVSHPSLIAWSRPGAWCWCPGSPEDHHNTTSQIQIISLTGQSMTSWSCRILEEIIVEKYNFFTLSRHQGSDVNENSFHARWINPGRWTTTIKHRLCPEQKT